MGRAGTAGLLSSGDRPSLSACWTLQFQRYGIIGATVFSCAIVVQMFYKTSMWAVNITALQVIEQPECNVRQLILLLSLLKAFKWGALVGALSASSLIMTGFGVRRMSVLEQLRLLRFHPNLSLPPGCSFVLTLCTEWSSSF